MKITPMLQQYLDAKERYPDAILFFRMGDFYEMFFEDAIIVSREVGLTLTARNKGGPNGKEGEVPMAGMPHHSSQTYVSQLIEKGFTVAICEQIEDPAKAQGIVKRDVVRVITPGVVLDTENLEASAPNYFAAVTVDDKGVGAKYGLAYLDISTGDLRATEVATIDDLLSELNRVEARELLIQQEHAEVFEALKPHLKGVFIRPKPPAFFDSIALETRVAKGVRLAEDLATDGFFLGVPEIQALMAGSRGFGFAALELIEAALCGVLTYVVDTRRGIPSNVHKLTPYLAKSFLVIDESTKSNLELTQTMMGGKRAGSLLSIMDRTVSALGGRRLRQWLNYPLISAPLIERRLDAVEEFVKHPALRADIRDALSDVYDIERLCGKVSSGSANARDLRSLLSTLLVITPIKDLLYERRSEVLRALGDSLDPCEDLCDLIGHAIDENPPVTLTEGGIFQKGYHDELDELIELSSNGKDWMLRYEAEERKRSGISSLKIKYNKVFGYYLEVTKANLNLVPDDYIRKQTLTNAERYFTPELKEMEERILGANEARMALEYTLFEELRGHVGDQIGAMLQTASGLAELDVLAALGELAQRNDYCRPEIHAGRRLVIEEGRHPVVEKSLSGERFVPNSVQMDTNARLLIITGPNMAGKSTVIRQVALITLMAQMGSFVPATAAKIGIVDKIFSRVGASDNLARGHSTFMVEMTETAHILNNATEASLIILDEIGRGTSTFDGLSIAWAVAEHLHETIRAKTMFATHYHELTELVRTLDAAVNLSIAVKEWQDDIIFLRKLVQGQANRSYGVQVGRLAGLPAPVVARAKEVLENLEAGQFDDMGIPLPGRRPGEVPRATRRHNPNQLTLFSVASQQSPQEQAALERLRAADINAMTPIEALNLLSTLLQTLEEPS